MKHANIAVFVPHAGCPHQCAFCDQKSISGAPKYEKEAAQNAFLKAKEDLAGSGIKAEIAFFGGSFTAIERERMISLLETAQPFIEDGTASGIRISTRPDAIDEEVLSVLRRYNVRAIELGAQSMDDGVLEKNRRGHNSQSIKDASRLIKNGGFELGLQMMTGLYGSNDETDLMTARELVKLCPDTVRVYPTIVLKNTMLETLLKAGEYAPQTLEQAVELCAKLLLIFHEADIPVIRLGLHSGGSVEEGYAAGPWHPAMRELCENCIYLERAAEAVERLEKPANEVRLHVAPFAVSKAVGQKRRNIMLLSERFKTNIRVSADSELSLYEVRAENIDE